MPRLAVAVLLLLLVSLASAMSYTGYLVVSTVAAYLDIGRVVAGLLLGFLFTRVPWIRGGKLRTIGLLPKPARLPVMLALLALSMLRYAYQGDWVPVLFLGFAAGFVLIFPRIRKKIAGQTIATLFKPPAGPHPSRPQRDDDTVIDVEFREKKD